MSLTVFFLIDGFSYNYLSRDNTPFLSSLTSNAIFCPVQPSGFFTCHSIYSGIYPAKHHNLFMYGYDPEKSPFKNIPSWTLPVDNLLPYSLKNIFRMFLSRSLFKKNKLASIPLRLAPYFRQFKPWEICPYPFIFDILKENHIPVIWDTRDYAFEQKKYLGRFFYTKLYGSHFLKWLKGNIKNAKDAFIFAQFPSKIDKLGHIFAPDSSQLKDEIKKTDENLNSIFDFISRYHKNFFFGIVSDHGMTSVLKCFDIWKYLKRLKIKTPKDYVFFLDATCARFWSSDSNIRNHLIQFLNQFSHLGKVLTPIDMKQSRLSQNYIWGEIIFAAKPGVLILPNFLQGKKRYQGAHGYFENTLPELKCLFLLYNESLSPKSPHMELPDIAPTVLNLFGLAPPEFYEGVSNLT